MMELPMSQSIEQRAHEARRRVDAFFDRGDRRARPPTCERQDAGSDQKGRYSKDAPPATN
jgi:hypothetical protein